MPCPESHNKSTGAYQNQPGVTRYIHSADSEPELLHDATDTGMTTHSHETEAVHSVYNSRINPVRKK